MARRWRLKDPRGKEVIFNDRAWFHSIDGHPEIAPYEKKVKEAVKSPDRILLSKNDNNAEIYERRSNIRSGMFKNSYTFVVAESIITGTRTYNKIKTAYLTFEQKEGDVRWQKEIKN